MVMYINFDNLLNSKLIGKREEARTREPLA